MNRHLKSRCQRVGSFWGLWESIPGLLLGLWMAFSLSLHTIFLLWVSVFISKFLFFFLRRMPYWIRSHTDDLFLANYICDDPIFKYLFWDTGCYHFKIWILGAYVSTDNTRVGRGSVASFLHRPWNAIVGILQHNWVTLNGPCSFCPTHFISGNFWMQWGEFFVSFKQPNQAGST